MIAPPRLAASSHVCTARAELDATTAGAPHTRSARHGAVQTASGRTVPSRSDRAHDELPRAPRHVQASRPSSSPEVRRDADPASRCGASGAQDSDERRRSTHSFARNCCAARSAATCRTKCADLGVDARLHQSNRRQDRQHAHQHYAHPPPGGQSLPPHRASMQRAHIASMRSNQCRGAPRKQAHGCALPLRGGFLYNPFED